MLAAVFAALIVSHGSPQLRHDWRWPGDRWQCFIDLRDAWSGWLPEGIGLPNPHMSGYLVASLVDLTGIVLGPYPSLVLLCFGVACLVLSAAFRAAYALCAERWASVAVAGFALFNPWVYCQAVAGHLLMVLAYGATLWLAALALAPLPTRRSQTIAATAAALLIAPQLQYLLVAWPLVALMSRRLRSWLPIGTLGIVSLPLALGVGLDYVMLRETPITEAWQHEQSVAPLKALFLSGYFTHYDDALPVFARIAAGTVAAVAAVGGLFAFTVRRLRWFFAGGAVAFVAATGDRFIVGPLYEALVSSVPAIGVYRELYDLIGYLAIAYVLFAAFLCGRFRAARFVVGAASAFLIVGWIAAPPSAFWLGAQGLPQLRVQTAPNTRFAVIPAFQPLTFDSTRTSGIDPDAFSRADDVEPLNEYSESYPGSAALAAAQKYGDRSALAALSVSLLISRPYYRQANSAASYPALATTISEPLGELTLCDVPAAAALANVPGRCNVFFADGAELGSRWAHFPRTFPLENLRYGVDAAKGWVDARLYFSRFPETAQAFGGATTSGSAVLPLAGDRWYLIWVSGILEDEHGRRLASGSGSYRWALAPASTTAVRCAGRCVIAAEASGPPGLPLNPPPRPSRTLHFQVVMPWAVVSALPPGPARTLRYNVRYDEHWIALAAGHLLPHVRIDTAVNGWVVAEHSAAMTVIMIQWAAAAQFVAALIALGWVCAITARLALHREEIARPRAPARKRPQSPPT